MFQSIRRKQVRRNAVVCALACTTLFAANHPVARAADSVLTTEDIRAGVSLADKLLTAQKPPFSFNYDGKPFAAQLADWKSQSEEKDLGDGKKQTTVTYTDPAGSLSVRFVSVRYESSPAFEWTTYIKNIGNADSKLIENLRGIDAPIGQAGEGSTGARKSWTPGKNFPDAATGGNFEMLRGWMGNFRPLAKSDVDGKARFALNGNAPWIGVDGDSESILLAPAQGIEGASDDPASGKSPGLAFVVPADGIYVVKGDITDIEQGGDGVEFVLGDSLNRVHASGRLDDGQSGGFERQLFMMAGEKVILMVHSRGNTDNDTCRVNFNVTQLGDIVPGDVVVHTNKGSDARDSDYLPMALGIGAGESLPLVSHGGRPSDANVIPFFNVEMPGTSALVAIGWPGQWDATFDRKTNDVHLNAGQQGVRFFLKPGEEVRTPLMAIVPYVSGDADRGQNIWRRWMIQHNMPKNDGKVMGSILNGNSSHQFNEMLNANEENQKHYIDRYLEENIKIDHWWMDAGWYINNGSWVNTGTWQVDPKRFPNGLKAITDHGRTKGVESIVWFEPERVTEGTELTNEHANFLLRNTGDPNNPMAGIWSRRGGSGPDPCISVNPTDKQRSGGPITWAPKTASLHPGPNGEYAILRFTAPAAGKYEVKGTFAAGDPIATTDVHVFHGKKAIFETLIGVDNKPRAAQFSEAVQAKAGETIDFVVGRGNEAYFSDTTNLEMTITGPGGKVYNVANDAKVDQNPAGPWSFGILPPAAKPAVSEFSPMTKSDDAASPHGWRLFNLGDAEARTWITNRINDLIEKQGVDIYRQDFNIEPIGYWRSGDGPGREGITENLYVQGYLKFWDDIIAKNPGIWIDTCASGGRRNDLETLRRSMPFLRSDRWFYPVGQQGQSYGINQWMPLHGTGMLIGKSLIMSGVDVKVDPYFVRSTMVPIWTISVAVEDRNLDYDKLRQITNQFREIGPSYLGDYYPLTKFSLATDQWIGWQFNLPTDGKGFIQVFRRDANDQNTLNVKLKGLDPAASYRIYNADKPDTGKTVKGEELMSAGYDITIDTKPGDALIQYQREGNAQ